MYFTMGSQLIQSVQYILSMSNREIVPSVIVDLVTVSGGIDNVEPQTYTVFFDDYNGSKLSMLYFPTRRYHGLTYCERRSEFQS